MMAEKHYSEETLSSVTTSPWILLNSRVAPFNVIAHVTVSAGADLRKHLHQCYHRV